jgi:hypothetical protein
MLDELANAKPDKSDRPRIFWLVRDAIRLGVATGYRMPRRFRSIRQVVEIHGNLIGRFLEHQDSYETSEILNLEFPDPPIPVPRYTQPKGLWI